MRARVWWPALLALVVLVARPAAGKTVSISGSVDYTGAQGPVSSNRPIQLVLGKGSRAWPFTYGQTAVTSNGAFPDLSVQAGNSYYLAYFLDLVGDGHLHIGDPLQFYNGRLVSEKADKLVIPTGGLPNLTLAFDDTGLAPGILGTVTYTGNQAVVSAQSPIRAQVFAEPTLSSTPVDQKVLTTNAARFEVLSVATKITKLYLRVYLDLNGNGELDIGEPFTIYDNKGSGPADPVTVTSMSTEIPISFDDAYIYAPAASPTPTPSPTVSPPASESPSPTPTLGPCAGDCNGTGQVTIDALVKGVGIALGNVGLLACPAFDRDGDRRVTVDELVRAVDAALNGCN